MVVIKSKFIQPKHFELQKDIPKWTVKETKNQFQILHCIGGVVREQHWLLLNGFDDRRMWIIELKTRNYFHLLNNCMKQFLWVSVHTPKKEPRQIPHKYRIDIFDWFFLHFSAIRMVVNFYEFCVIIGTFVLILIHRAMDESLCVRISKTN